MEIRWGKNYNKKTSNVPGGVYEDTSELITRERRYASAIDEIVSNHAKQGGFENLEGKGKPLDLSDELTENYYLNRVLKNANVLPEWLELQHQIRDSIGKLIERLECTQAEKFDEDLETINVRIKKYNQMVPSPILQKTMITAENLHIQYDKWK